MSLSSCSINKKIIAMLGATCVAFIIIITQLLYLQIYCADHFLLQSQKNFIRHEMVDPLRGNIRDVNGKLLATNRPITCLFWQGTGNRSLSQRQLEILQHLEEI